MRTASLQWLLLGAICCLLGSAVGARKGGGGGSGSDRGSDGGSDGNGSGEGAGCAVYGVLPRYLYYDLPSHRFTTSPTGRCKIRDKDCSGPYYVGKTTVQYSLENGEGEVLRDGGICGSQGVQATASPEVMLGVAALGPQYDIDGLTNTFILGFDAYRPDPPVDDVDPLDWSGCYSFPHNIHFATTSKYHNPPQGQISDARDLVKLSLSASNISSTVYFNGTYMGHPKEDYNPGLTMWDVRWHEFRPGGSLCEAATFDTTSSLSSNTAVVDTTFPNGTIVRGSISRDALSLTLEGVLPISVRNKTFLNFTVDFRGTFDSANSTHSAVMVNGTDVTLSGTETLVPARSRLWLSLCCWLGWLVSS